MKKSKAIVLALVFTMVLSMAALFTGCGKPDTLEEYINSDADAKAQIDALATDTAAEGDEMSIDIKENTVTYTYKFGTTYDSATVEAMKPTFKSAMESQDSVFEGVASDLEEESGVENVTIAVVYLNGDDSEIFSKTYK